MKEFNTTGLCVPGKPYMVDTSNKISEDIIGQWNAVAEDEATMTSLGEQITMLCEKLDKDVILIIDEIDK